VEFVEKPLEESYERFERIQVEVAGVVSDDHGNTIVGATALSVSTVEPGIIEMAGDVDVFETIAPDDGAIAFRVTNLALGMDPVLGVYNSLDELIKEVSQSDSEASGGYAVATVDATSGELLYAKVAHQSASGTGWYQISAGNVLFTDLPEVLDSDDPDGEDDCSDWGFFFIICWIGQFFGWLFDILIFWD